MIWKKFMKLQIKKIYKLYKILLKKYTIKHGYIILSLISFSESAFFIIPTYVPLILLCTLNKNKILHYATLATFFSVVGGILGYFLGYFLFESFLQDFLIKHSYMDKFNDFKKFYDKFGALAIFLGGFTPIPYKIIAISCGVLNFNVVYFIALSLFSRGSKFYLIGYLIKYSKKMIKKN